MAIAIGAFVGNLLIEPICSAQTDLEGIDPILAEVAILKEARDALRAGDEGAADGHLLKPPSRGLVKKSTSSLYAQRVAGACGWLWNDGDTARAIKLAKKAVRDLEKMSEDSDEDHVDRLYWEAWLEAEILDHKVRAVELLKAAEVLKSDDDRVVFLQLKLVSAIAEFGK